MKTYPAAFTLDSATKQRTGDEIVYCCETCREFDSQHNTDFPKWYEFARAASPGADASCPVCYNDLEDGGEEIEEEEATTGRA